MALGAPRVASEIWSVFALSRTRPECSHWENIGDVVRWAPNALSFRTVEALHDVYADRDANMIKTG